MWFSAIAALALGIVHQGVGAQSCNLPEKTLTFECGGACDANVPCWYNTTTAETAKACKFACMKVYDFTEEFSLYLPFESVDELVPPSPFTIATSTFISSEYLDFIDAMNLPTAITTVYATSLLVV